MMQRRTTHNQRELLDLLPSRPEIEPLLEVVGVAGNHQISDEAARLYAVATEKGLAQLTGIAPSSIARTLNNLAAKGLVDGITCPAKQLIDVDGFSVLVMHQTNLQTFWYKV